MKVLVTGAAGFLGSAVVRLAREQGHEVRALVRPSSDVSALDLAPDQIAVGDLSHPASLAAAAEGMQAVIHCAAATSETASDPRHFEAVNIEGTRNLLAAAEQAGARRWIQISSMSAHESMPSHYGRTKFEADKLVRASSLDWTILQPSIIYGPGERGLVAKTARMLRRLPVLPIIGPGTELIRPIHADDVALAALAALERPTSIKKTYMLGGADEVTLEQFMKLLAERAGLRRPVVHIPIGLALFAARALGLIMKSPPVTADNVFGVKFVRRVKLCAAETDLDFKPRSLADGLRSFG